MFGGHVEFNGCNNPRQDVLVHGGGGGGGGAVSFFRALDYNIPRSLKPKK